MKLTSTIILKHGRTLKKAGIYTTDATDTFTLEYHSLYRIEHKGDVMSEKLRKRCMISLFTAAMLLCFAVYIIPCFTQPTSLYKRSED